MGVSLTDLEQTCKTNEVLAWVSLIYPPLMSLLLMIAFTFLIAKGSQLMRTSRAVVSSTTASSTGAAIAMGTVVSSAVAVTAAPTPMPLAPVTPVPVTAHAAGAVHSTGGTTAVGTHEVAYVGPLTCLLSWFVPCFVWCPVDKETVSNDHKTVQYFGGCSLLWCLLGWCCVICCPIDNRHILDEDFIAQRDREAQAATDAAAAEALAKQDARARAVAEAAAAQVAAAQVALGSGPGGRWRG